MGSSRGLRPRTVAALAALVVIVCLAQSVLGYVVLARLSESRAAAPGSAPVTHVPLSRVTAMLEADGLECDQGYSSPVSIWYCFGDRAHDTSAVTIQVTGRSEVGLLTAHVAPSAPSEPEPRSYATYLLGRIAAALVDRRSAAQVRTWIGAHIGSAENLDRQFGSTWLTLGLVGDGQGTPVQLLAATLAGTQKRSVPTSVLSGARATDVEAYFRARGLSCGPAAPTKVACTHLSATATFAANIEADPGGVSVVSFNAIVASAPGDPTAAARDLFTGAVGLVLRGGDAARAGAWVHDDLDGLPHEHAVSGVHIVIIPRPAFASLSQGGEVELAIDPLPW